jgi:putative transposase
MRLRRSPRLSHFDYKGRFTYHLVLVTKKRRPVFTDMGEGLAVLEVLELSCRKHGFTLLAYCLMPDHLHVLVAGSDGAALRPFVQQFKQVTGYRYKRRKGEGLWQISYYDHVLRRDEDVEALSRYIWGNPVRAGLVGVPEEYPLSGPRELMT